MRTIKRKATVHLVKVKKYDGASDFLWKLLEQRAPEESISHEAMPTREQHDAFVFKHPYRLWYIVVVPGADGNDIPVGAAYLTWDSELGVTILREHQRQGYATFALRWITKKFGAWLRPVRTNPHVPPVFLANVNPANAASIALFEKLGFATRQLVLAAKPEDVQYGSDEEAALGPSEALE